MARTIHQHQFAAPGTAVVAEAMPVERKTQERTVVAQLRRYRSHMRGVVLNTHDWQVEFLGHLAGAIIGMKV